VGLLHSLPRLDAGSDEPLIPIEGVPPDLRLAPVGCQFAARCAWRVDQCWLEIPPFLPVEPGTTVRTTGPDATHRIACWNPPTPEEASAGRPLRLGFVAAAPPAGSTEVHSDEEGESAMPGSHGSPESSGSGGRR
jgi:oligopeptide/dipeptide ABC transporter ATP-binding protein